MRAVRRRAQKGARSGRRDASMCGASAILGRSAEPARRAGGKPTHHNRISWFWKVLFTSERKIGTVAVAAAILFIAAGILTYVPVGAAGPQASAAAQPPVAAYRATLD